MRAVCVVTTAARPKPCVAVARIAEDTSAESAMRMELRRRRRIEEAGLDFLTGHAAVALKDARGRELAELVADHVFGDVNGGENLAIVNAERVADEIRRDRRAAGPSLNGFLDAGFDRLFDFLEEVVIDKKTFFDGTCHGAKEIGLFISDHAAFGRCGGQ
jgi:hypothetical protein